MHCKITRRRFLRTAAGTGAGVLVLGDASLVRGYAANEAVAVGQVGVAGRGLWFTERLLPRTKGIRLAALCDVDRHKARGVFEKYPALPKFADFREMLDKAGKDLDGVIVATPDNTHAVASAAAIRAGKAVFTEKPLTHDVYESHVLRTLAAEKKVATQMGNQGTSSRGFRRADELIAAGAIGKVTEAWVWCMGGGGGRPRVNKKDVPCPETLSWDLWLGPAERRPYHPVWMRWQQWRDFGTNTLGNWGSHSANLVFKALKIDRLWHAKAASKPRLTFRGAASEVVEDRWPHWWTCRWDVPARAGLDPVTVRWVQTTAPEYQTLLERFRAFECKLDPKQKVPDYPGSYHTGCFLVGEKGAIVSNSHNTTYQLLPARKYKDYVGPREKAPRSRGHEREWAHAVRGGPAAWSNFDYSGPLNEMLQLANVANRVPGEDLEYDPLACRVTNSAKADALLRRDYRDGWRL